MSIFFIKSLLSVVLILLTITAMYTMFEVFGRDLTKYNTKKLIKVHKMNGRLYFLIFAVVSYFCIEFIILSKTEMSVRGAFHFIFALTILVLMGIKITLIRTYKKYYDYAKTFGFLMGIMTFLLAGTSGGYYFLVSEFGTDTKFDKIMQYKKQAVSKGIHENSVISISSAPESIERGKALFDTKCKFCHNAYDTETTVGPGLKGILRQPRLPVSGHKASPENIIRQLKQPLNRMPSFDYLSDREIEDLLSFLNTL